MNGHVLLGLALFVMALGGTVRTTSADREHFIGCPEGHAVRGIDLHNGKVQCVAVGTQIAALQATVAALQAQVNAVMPFVSVDPNPINGLAGPHIIFTGVNVHIRSGSGATDDTDAQFVGSNVLADPLGLGNLVIGYNEQTSGNPARRGGSHNLVVGPHHAFPSVGGFVAGFRGTVNGAFSTVSGGFANTASGGSASVSGGFLNTASGFAASVSGGMESNAQGNTSSVSGGLLNGAIGEGSSISAGFSNRAFGTRSSVTGGESNIASGGVSSVSGGSFRTAPGFSDWVAGSLFEDF